MNAPMKRSDSIAEGVIVAIVVIVLGIAATSTKLDPAPNVVDRPDRREGADADADRARLRERRGSTRGVRCRTSRPAGSP